MALAASKLHVPLSATAEKVPESPLLAQLHQHKGVGDRTRSPKKGKCNNDRHVNGRKLFQSSCVAWGVIVPRPLPTLTCHR